MDYKYFLIALLAITLFAEALAVNESGVVAQIPDSSEPLEADLAIIDANLKTSTERPPTKTDPTQNGMMIEMNENPKQQNAQPHTVADFIIHPLIAFKARAPGENLAGKQVGAATSTTLPSLWTILGFNATQGLGSSVSSLAGSVTGWLNERIQLPSLVESPVSGASSTTTTTQRPDVIVRVQHKAPTRRPLISIKNRPQNLNNFYSDEYDEDEFDEDKIFPNNKNKNKNKKRKPNRDEEDEVEEDIEDNENNRPVRRRQQNQLSQKRRRRPVVDDFSEEDDEYNDDNGVEEDDDDDANNENDENNVEGSNKRRFVVPSNNNNNHRRIQKPLQSDEVEEDDDDVDDVDVDEHVQFYYGSRPSIKRSQAQASFFQKGQENILNQIRQLTNGQTPADIGTLLRKPSSTTQNAGKPKRRQQTTLLINRNGQTIYLAPELMSTNWPLVNTQASQFPMSMPLKRKKNSPTQYITIPWSQLGISSPDQLNSLTKGIQSQPLILNIPTSALKTLQNQSQKQKKQPVITAAAVPLLAETPIVNALEPSNFPNDRRTPVMVTHKTSSSSKPVMNATKKKSGSSVILPQRIRLGTIVDKASKSSESEQQKASAEKHSSADTVRKLENHYILVGDDAEMGLERQVPPIHGEARYDLQTSPYSQHLRREEFDVSRNGRELDTEAAEHLNVNQMQQQLNGEQLIPVQIVSEPEMVEKSQDAKPLSVDKQPQSELPETQSKVIEESKATIGQTNNDPKA